MVVGGGGQALNRLNGNRALFKVRSPIKKMIGLGLRCMTLSGPVQSLKLVVYSSVLPKIPESRRPLFVSTPTDLCLKSSVYV